MAAIQQTPTPVAAPAPQMTAQMHQQIEMRRQQAISRLQHRNQSTNQAPSTGSPNMPQRQPSIQDYIDAEQELIDMVEEHGDVHLWLG